MPGLVGNPPLILTPGFGPERPRPHRLAQAPVTAVATRTRTGSLPRTGCAGSSGRPQGRFDSRRAGTCDRRESNNNGGIVHIARPRAQRQRPDVVTSDSTTTFTSASAAFTSADIGKGICIRTPEPVQGIARSLSVRTAPRSITVRCAGQHGAGDGRCHLGYRRGVGRSAARRSGSRVSRRTTVGGVLG